MKEVNWSNEEPGKKKESVRTSTIAIEEKSGAKVPVVLVGGNGGVGGSCGAGINPSAPCRNESESQSFPKGNEQRKWQRGRGEKE